MRASTLATVAEDLWSTAQAQESANPALAQHLSDLAETLRALRPEDKELALLDRIIGLNRLREEANAEYAASAEMLARCAHALEALGPAAVGPLAAVQPRLTAPSLQPEATAEAPPAPPALPVVPVGSAQGANSGPLRSIAALSREAQTLLALALLCLMLAALTGTLALTGYEYHDDTRNLGPSTVTTAVTPDTPERPRRTPAPAPSGDAPQALQPREPTRRGP